MSATPGTILLADVGGTNTRVAVAGPRGPENAQRFDNGDFASFYDVLDRYVTGTDIGPVDACSVAMAGPVRGGQGRLTNRGWEISVTGIRQHLDCSAAELLNDLTALGFSLGTLPADSIAPVGKSAPADGNGQSLVIGIGTGFNLCPVRRSAGGSVGCLEVEMGHAALPTPLHHALLQHLGKDAAHFPTLEHLFSGSGLAHFHALRSGGTRSAREVVEASAAGDVDATRTLDDYTRLLGQLCSELAFQYMPLDGVYFAGSVARGILQPAFFDNLQGPPGTGKIGDTLAVFPKWVILDDAAALRGCLAALRSST